MNEVLPAESGDGLAGQVVGNQFEDLSFLKPGVALGRSGLDDSSVVRFRGMVKFLLSILALICGNEVQEQRGGPLCDVESITVDQCDLEL